VPKAVAAFARTNLYNNNKLPKHIHTNSIPKLDHARKKYVQINAK